MYFRHCQSKFKFNTLPSRIISHVKLIEGEVWHSASYETRFYAVPLQAGQRHHDIRITQFRSLSGHLNNSSNRIHWETDYVTTAKFTVWSLASCLIVGWLFRRHTNLFFFVPDDIENRWYSNSPSHNLDAQGKLWSVLVHKTTKTQETQSNQGPSYSDWGQLVRHHGSWFKTILRL